MSRISRSIIRWLITSAFATGSFAFIGQRAAGQTASTSDPVAPCYAVFNGQLMYVSDVNFTGCARTIQAAKPTGAEYGYGSWGSISVVIDLVGNTYFNQGNGWFYYGEVRNPSGTVGSLSDQCNAGNTAACNQWSLQTQNAIVLFNQLYPSGWSQG